MAATSAQQQGGVSAPVEHDNRLFTQAKSFLQLFLQLRGNHCLFAVALKLERHVNQSDLRQRTCLESLGQSQVSDFSRVASAMKSLDRGCRRSHDQDPGGLLNPVPGNLTGMIDGRLVLLVRSVLLFVDDDQSDIVQGRKHGRTGSHNHTGVPGPESDAIDRIARPVTWRCAGGRPGRGNGTRRCGPAAGSVRSRAP